MVAVSHDGDTFDRVTSRTVDADRCNLQTGMWLAPHCLDELGDRSLQPDDHHTLHAPPVTTQ